jgi:hypothetical protein
MEHSVPRYFFHVNDGKDWPDDDGTVLPDATTARAQAVETAGAMLKDEGKSLWDGAEWRMDVVDETGQTVCELHFSARC